jgi:hypothetical protein
MRARAEYLVLLLITACGTVFAQDVLPRAPRIGAATQTTGAPSTPSLRPPTAARLAPLPEQRRDVPDEIIVTGQGWRLPDLGSGWRAEQRANERDRRLHAVLLPLYDPNRPPLRAEGFWLNREAQRHGYIELFRFRFGRRKEE